MTDSQRISRLFLASLVVLALAFLPAMVPPAGAGMEFNEVVPFEFDDVHPCTGEDIHVEGTSHILYHLEGEHRDSFHFNDSGTAEIISTGEQCVFRNIYNDQCTSGTQCGLNLDAEDFDLTFRQNFRVICPGATPNFIITQIVHLSFPPFEVEVLHENARCAGKPQ